MSAKRYPGAGCLELVALSPQAVDVCVIHLAEILVVVRKELVKPGPIVGIASCLVTGRVDNEGRHVFVEFLESMLDIALVGRKREVVKVASGRATVSVEVELTWTNAAH